MIEIKFDMEDGKLYINGALTAQRGNPNEPIDDSGIYSFADLIDEGGLDEDEFICLFEVIKNCFPSLGLGLNETSSVDVRLTKQDVGSFLSGVDTEIPLPDIGDFQFQPSEDV